MSAGKTHIIGAGLAGLAAAARLAAAGRKVVVHELARHAGGRCRSYFEPALGLTIDNGNHLLLSGNDAALAYAETIGTKHLLAGPANPQFDFVDLKNGERWRINPNMGAVPWWIFRSSRRVPGSRAADYFALGRLLLAGHAKTIGEVIDCASPLYHRLWRPILLAALNCEPPEASARLAGAVIRETLARGGHACRPLVAESGLGPVLVDPALKYIEQHGGEVRLNDSLRAIAISGDRATNLKFEDGSIALLERDAVILAVPAWVARTFLPGLIVPEDYRSIFNVHYKIAPPAGLARITAAINATVEWLFAFPDRLSVTVSAADRFNEAEREPLAREIWSEVSRIARIDAPMPPWQIVKERRATFAAKPSEDAKRPEARTRWGNVWLAGDWTATGLPATIEGAIRSGNKAADLVMAARA